ncbi:MAG TPA: ABC transporter permease [Gemmatimonadales bacterium]
MHSILALLRHDALTAASYRLNSVLSLLSLAVTTVPLYLVTDALQPLMEGPIDGEGDRFFAFVLVGIVALRWATVGATALPGAVSGAIRQGRLETLLLAPVPLPMLLAGMIAYQLAWVMVESVVVIGAGLLLGVRLAWAGVPWVLPVLVLITLAYTGIGLVAATLQLRFRTSGPLLNGTIVVSVLLGGVYYPTSVVPSWIAGVADAVPLVYGLRALRGMLLEGTPPAAAAGDLGVLAMITVALLAASGLAFDAALRQSRRAGTLAQY